VFGWVYDLVWLLFDGQGNATLLNDLLTILLSPYDDLGPFKGRLRVAVERMGVGRSSATALALVIHELATNSMKYGALSAHAGTLDVTSETDGDDIIVRWVERGGPTISRPDGLGGFGSKLVQRSVSGQLGGSIDYDWDKGGLIVTLRMSRTRLAV